MLFRSDIAIDDHWRYKRLTLTPDDHRDFPYDEYREGWIDVYKNGKRELETHYRLEHPDDSGST